MPSALGPAAPRIRALAAQVLVMYTTGSQSLAALALANSLRNEMHWAPSGTVTRTSGAASARLDTWACGGASSPSSTVSSATISSPASSAAALKLSIEMLPNSLLT